MYDVNQAREFIQALTGSPDSVVTFQAFYDPKGLDAPKGVAQVWHSTLQDSLEYIDHKQNQFAGIYVCINGTDLQGREIYNITHLRVLFADYDGKAQPQWVLPPHFVQERDSTHGHAFWLIEPGDLTHDEWSILQKQIGMFYGTDEQVVDPCRVVRLPGTLHLKNPSSPQVYRIISNHSAVLPRYKIDAFRQAHALPAEKDAILNQWAEARAGINTGVGYEDNEQELRKFTGFIKNAALPAVIGSGTHELFRVACYGHDHGISLEKAKELLWEHYNPRCLPPWGDHERHHFDGVVYRAYHYATSAPGCKTARASFLALGPLPEPNCGWENQKAQFNQVETVSEQTISVIRTEASPVQSGHVFRFSHRLTHDQALMLLPQLTAKSSHYDFARAFDGINYDGTRLIRYRKQFYSYNGRCWEATDDDEMKACVQRAFSIYKPAEAFTAGIFNVLKDLVNVRKAENGSWLSDRETPTANYAVFKNGIVDLNSADMQLMPHTSEFFSLNELTHDFNPSAQCPRMLEYLSSIWDNNEDLKMQLQEFMGYCLTTDTSLQKFAVFAGKTRAGKGTITTILTHMVGVKNIASPSLSKLVKDSTLNEMANSLLTLIPDVHDVNGSIKDEVLSNFKSITGEDRLSAHELYKGSRSLSFKTKIVLSTNNFPNFNDPSGALVNRMLAFPFYKTFADRENFNLKNELLAEIEGITQWAIEGLRRLRRNNGKFTESKLGLAQKDKVRRDTFPLADFISHSCELESDSFTMIDDLYSAYRLWAAGEGVKMPMLKKDFDKTLRSSSLPITDDLSDNRKMNGIRIKQYARANNVIGFPPVGNV